MYRTGRFGPVLGRSTPASFDNCIVSHPHRVTAPVEPNNHFPSILLLIVSFFVTQKAKGEQDKMKVNIAGAYILPIPRMYPIKYRPQTPLPVPKNSSTLTTTAGSVVLWTKKYHKRSPATPSLMNSRDTSYRLLEETTSRVSDEAGCPPASRACLLLADGHSCYRTCWMGERQQKSVRGCIVGPDIAVLSLVIVKHGDAGVYTFIFVFLLLLLT